MKVLVSLGFALFLFWYLYRDGFPETLQRMKEVRYPWVMLSICIGVLSHLLRAYRWKLLLEPTGHHPSVKSSLVALFVGYLINFIVPRLGELSRCLVLKRTDQIPVTSSLGTVVSERVLDVLSLLIITGITLILEFEKLNDFFSDFFSNKLTAIFLQLQQYWLFGFVLLLALTGIWIITKKRIYQSGWWKKLKALAREMWLGFISITQLKKPWAFWASTVGIWVMYYFMSYVVFFAMDPTGHLGWRAGLALLVMGGLAMSAPVQGGIGAYHLLVAGFLLYYGVSKEDGLSFAFLLHSSQMVLIIIAGVVSGILVLLTSKKPQTPGDSKDG